MQKQEIKQKTKNKTGPSAKILTFSSFLKLKRLFHFSQEKTKNIKASLKLVLMPLARIRCGIT